MVVTVDKTYLQQLGLQCRRILMDKPHNRMPVIEFKKVFARYYNRECSLEEIQKELPTIVQVRKPKNNIVKIIFFVSYLCKMH